MLSSLSLQPARYQYPQANRVLHLNPPTQPNKKFRSTAQPVPITITSPPHHLNCQLDLYDRRRDVPVCLWKSHPRQHPLTGFAKPSPQPSNHQNPYQLTSTHCRCSYHLHLLVALPLSHTCREPPKNHTGQSPCPPAHTYRNPQKPPQSALLRVNSKITHSHRHAQPEPTVKHSPLPPLLPIHRKSPTGAAQVNEREEIKTNKEEEEIRSDRKQALVGSQSSQPK